MSQLEHIEAIEKRLWSAADTLRANSNHASNEYFLPVMGLIFLRHAYSRFLLVKDAIEPHLPMRAGKRRPLCKEDFSQKGAIFLQPCAQFEYLVALPESENRAAAIVKAMESIEADYTNLQGILPKNEYQELDNAVLGQLLHNLNPDELKTIKGDVFGRIYEYFLTQFADQKAHDGGEFFTPISLVSLIANILEPTHGVVLDPACGSGGMFVQSARVVERQHYNPNEKLTFYGLEKKPTTIRLAKMNLAVHGLEGDIQKAITYYEDPHELLGKAHYVMANPPFNVDDIDADKITTDPRLPFGLPGINKQKRVSSGNYIWISYFYSYLNKTGRAGFVMSSQASSAGRDEAKIRQRLVESGDVDVMIAIRPNFFYTRTVPCELWFFDRAKAASCKDSILMIDAQSLYRKVTRSICDFSPEQEQNILAMVWLYRGETERYIRLVNSYCQRVIQEGQACLLSTPKNIRENANTDANRDAAALPIFLRALDEGFAQIAPLIEAEAHEAIIHSTQEYEALRELLNAEAADLQTYLIQEHEAYPWNTPDNVQLLAAIQRLAGVVDASRKVIKLAESAYKSLLHVLDECDTVRYKKHANPTGRKFGSGRKMGQAKIADAARHKAIEQLKKVRYFYRQAQWLVERFPEAKLRDVAGLVKVVQRSDIAANDYSLTPGRYVGVAPEQVDEDFDFEDVMRTLHAELEDLNAESVVLAEKIKANFEGLGI